VKEDALRNISLISEILDTSHESIVP
jgi:hypothetical protein